MIESDYRYTYSNEIDDLHVHVYGKCLKLICPASLEELVSRIHVIE